MSNTAADARSGVVADPDAVPVQDIPAPDDTLDDDLVPTLVLADLVQDSNGEIVLFNDSHLPSLAVRAESQPIAAGAIGQHVTAAGDDVSGFRFVAFDDGTKLYYQDSLDLIVVGDRA